MKVLKSYIILGCIIGILWALPAIAQTQGSGVSAEAIQQANLRSATDVNSDLLGQIVSGNRYPVIGRSQYYPWILLGDPSGFQPIGWVYTDLVTIYGDIDAVPFTENSVSNSVPTLTLAPTQAIIASEEPPVFGVAVPTNTPAATIFTSSTGVTGIVTGEINIRYGPGVDYPRIGVAKAGEQYEITARHTQFPWVQIRYPQAPNGYGWVANDLLDIQGNLFDVPATSQTVFDLPTLTATPPVVQASNLLDTTEVPISPNSEH